MLKLKRVAVTGGLSCGKSSVCRIFHELGAYVISADEVVHRLLYSADSSLGQKVIKLLGNEILVNHHIDRAKVAELVFSNPDLLQALENLLHPVVYSEIEKEYQRQSQEPDPPPLFVAEIPLLFETGGENLFPITIAVIADEELSRRRFCHVNRQSPQEYINRMSRQLPNKEKARRSSFVITNNGSISDLRQAAKALYQKLIKAGSVP